MITTDFIKNIKGTKILVVGDLMLDLHLHGRAIKISPEAPVPVVMAESRTSTPGGAANVMKNLQMLGCCVTGVGFVGNDNEGLTLLELLGSSQINVESIITSKLSTINKTRVIADGQHVVRFDFDSDFGGIKNEQANLVDHIETIAMCRKFDAVIISDYCKGTITLEVAKCVIQNFKCPIIVDSKRDHKNYFAGAWCITPNLHEAQLMVGAEGKGMPPIKLAAVLKEGMRLKTVIITMADQGIFCLDENDKSIIYPAYVQLHKHEPKQYFDVTGAGDTIVSAFAACVAGGAKTFESVYVANLAAGVVVRKIGTSYCSLEELLEIK